MTRACVAAFLAFILTAQFLYAADREVIFKTDVDKLSYQQGVQIAFNYIAQGADPDVDAIINCIKNVLEYETPSETNDDESDINTFLCTRFGQDFKDRGFTPNFEMLANGIKDYKDGKMPGKEK